MSPASNARLLDRLLADALIRPEQREAALDLMARTGDRAEEALLDLATLSEPQLLKYLATFHRTRFVSTEKLARAEIDQLTLEKVPKKLAEHWNVFPVLFDAQSGTLSVVTPDPDNEVALQELRVAAGVRDVRAFVGRPRAVKAAINKGYNGDIHAFATLDRASHEQFSTMLDVYERRLVSEESLTTSLAKESVGERVLSQTDLHQGGRAAVAGKGITDSAYLETLNVLVTLLENLRPGLRGHSAHVARLMRRAAERIGLSEISRASLQLAGHIHDLGKMGKHHLTALNVAKYESYTAAAQKLYQSPLHLFEAVGLPTEVTRAVGHMYERHGGGGIPDGLSGKEIPLGARLLAIADTYADLTQNPRNAFRKALTPAQACEVLARHKESIFDPNLVDLFRIMVSGEDVKARLLSNRHRALIVDPDPEETTVLELRMFEQGFEVEQAHALEQALKVLEKGETELVVSEVDLAAEDDGFRLLDEVRRQPWGKKLPWVFVTSRSGRADAQRAFELGAVDYVIKPVSADVLVAKLRQLLERESVTGNAARGVSGSLSEMGLPDMVQILWHGRKTGSLKIRSGRDNGEIHFVDGAVYNVLYANLRGEEAFYAMLALPEGDFFLDPNFRAPQRILQSSPEALLLEGMRRLDEAGR